MISVTVRVSGAIVVVRAGIEIRASIDSGLYPSAPMSRIAELVDELAEAGRVQVLTYVASFRLRGIIFFFECFGLDYATTASVFVMESVTTMGIPRDSVGVGAVMSVPAAEPLALTIDRLFCNCRRAC